MCQVELCNGDLSCFVRTGTRIVKKQQYRMVAEPECCVRTRGEPQWPLQSQQGTIHAAPRNEERLAILGHKFECPSRVALVSQPREVILYSFHAHFAENAALGDQLLKELPHVPAEASDTARCEAALVLQMCGKAGHKLFVRLGPWLGQGQTIQKAEPPKRYQLECSWATLGTPS